MRYLTLNFFPFLFVLLTAFILQPSPAPAYTGIPEQGVLEFEILRNGSPFGRHYLEFEEDGDRVKVDISIDMKASLAFLTFFEYKHRNTEIKRGGQLVSIDAFTNDDGKEWFVEARLEGDSIVVERTRDNYEAPKTIGVATYWDKTMLEHDKLLNTQKGMVQEISVTKLDVEQVEVAGEYILAQRFKISIPERDIHVWYHTETDQWVGLRFNIRGSELDYRRLTPITSSSDTNENG